MRMQEKNQRGFTLVELIAVIVLLSILGVVALSRLDSMGGFESKAFYDNTINALRYGQKLAISTGCNVQINLTTGGYDLHQRQTSCTSGFYTRDVIDPVERTSPYENFSPPTGVTINPVAQFVFTAESTVTGLAGDTVFSIDGRQFTVYQNTGLIDAQ